MAERNLKPFLIGAVVVLLAVTVSVGATLYFLSGQSANAPAGAELVAEAPETVPLDYFEFEKPFISSVTQGGKTRYLQVFLAAALREPAAGEAMKLHLPLLRSRLLTLLGSGDFLTLQTEAGREALKSDALAVINGVLEDEGAPTIERVLFTNFVLQ